MKSKLLEEAHRVLRKRPRASSEELYQALYDLARYTTDLEERARITEPLAQAVEQLTRSTRTNSL